MKIFPQLGAALAALALAGCATRAPINLADSGTREPVPTVAPIFGDIPTSIPAPTLAPSATPGRTAAPTPSLVPAPTAAAGSDPTEGLQKIPVYADGMYTGWGLGNSTLMEYDTRSIDYVDQGRYAIKAWTTSNFASLYFTVREDAKQPYRRDQILGVRFRLSGGDQSIGNDRLAVAVTGSNSQPYWVPNDTSAQIEGRVTNDSPIFSETRLYYLNINRSIPPKTWVDVVVWLDDLQYDPVYTYLTGFYLKTDGLDQFYVDQVELLALPEAATPTP